MTESDRGVSRELDLYAVPSDAAVRKLVDGPAGAVKARVLKRVTTERDRRLVGGTHRNVDHA